MTRPAGDRTAPGQTAVVRTFLIADIRGYTRFTQERGDEAAARLAARFAEVVQEGLEATGGELVELRGDEALGVFASARQAIRAAVELQEVLDGALDQDGSPPLGVGMGLDAGEAVPVADGYRGGALNLAARLCARAGAGEVLASQGVVHLARTMPGIGFEPLAPLELKGLAQPVAAVRVVVDRPATRVRPRPGPPPGRVELAGGLDLSGPLVGREGELRWLRWGWRRVLAGHGRVVSLSGPPGIGKTRLAAELAREVHAAGWPVQHARCAGPAAAALAALRPAGSGVGPMLLVVDDLDLAAGPVLDAVGALVERASADPIMVVGAHRHDRSPSVGFDQATTADEHRRRLGPLDAAGAGKVASLYLRRPGRRVPVEALLAQTEGVPLLVHRWASQWARQELAGRLGASVAQATSGRRGLRAVEAELAASVIDRQFTDERQQLYLVEEPEAAAGGVVCPFKGLARFEADDAGFFFGRERLVAELVARLAGAGLVGVVGPSGSGKSSLIRAGLLPALRDGVLPGSDRWTQLVLRPGEHPMAELQLALGTDTLVPTAGVTGDGGVAVGGDERASGGPVRRPAAANLLLAAAGAPARLLVVVDQFEEVFTACHDAAERAKFLATLVEAAQASDGQATVVVAVRADYYGHCAADARLASLLAANHLLVGPMDAEELRRAIELPARRAGLRLEAGLAEAMLAEVADEPGGLPLLSCALLESWQHRQGRTLTLAAYQQAGGVRGAVARLAERAWLGLDPEQQQTARRVLLRLAGPGEGEQVVRRRVPLTEVTPGGDEPVRAVVNRLADQRLLTKAEDTVEVAHEALLREWPRLRGWLEEDVQGRALHRHLIGTAREWDQSGRDPGELYRGARLTGALDWAREHDADLNQLERDFLAASRAAGEREVADARRRAEREAQTSRRLRGLLVGLAVVLVLALVAGGLALSLRGRAERVALVADSRRLGAQALLADELDRSLLLARQGIALDDSLETRSDLLAALLRSPAATAILRDHLDGIAALDLSHDGRLLAVGDGGGRVAIFDVRTRRPLHEWSQSYGQVSDLEFSPDGALLAESTFGQGDPVYLWDVQGAGVLRTLSRRGAADANDAVLGMQFSADGRTLATLSTEDNPEPGRGAAYLTRWSVGSGRRTGPVRVSSHGGDALLATPDGSRLVVVNGAEVLVNAANTFRPLRRFRHKLVEPRFFVAALSPRDGRTLALWSEAGPIERLDLLSGRRRPVGRDDGGAWSVRFSPDGKTLVTGDGDGSVKVWDVASGQLRERFQGHEARVLGLRFSPDGQTLYSSGSKSVIAWDLKGDSRLARPFSLVAGPTPYRGSLQPPETLAVSSDGALLAAPVASAPDHIALLDLRSPRQARRPLAPGIGTISAMAFSRDGRQLAVAGDHASGPVVIDPMSGVVRKRMSGGHRGGVNAIGFDREGRRLVTGGKADQQAIVWNVETGEPIRNLQHPASGTPEAVAVRWSPDGSVVATAGAQGKIMLWSATDWRQLATLTADTRAILAVAFSPDGSLVAASGTGERAVTLWDVATHKRVGLLSHPIFVGFMAFDPGGHTLATSAGDGMVRLWDVASSRQIGVGLPGPEGGRTSVSGFDSSGTHLIALYDSDTAVVWDMDPGRWEEHACTVVGRSLTPAEWKELLPDRRYQPACR